MATIVTRPLLLAFSLLVIPVLAPAQAPTTGTDTLTETAPTESKKRNRAISGETSSALSAGFSYQPPKPVEPSENDLVDQRDIDKPRNEIIRLPKYMVEGVRPPVFSERNLYSKDDFAKLAMQRYLGKNGLNKYQLGKTGEAYALQMYWDDERLKNMMEGDRQVSLYRAAGDEEKAAKVEAENRSMFLRVNDAQSAEKSKMAGQRY
jgi:hypothetical protein